MLRQIKLILCGGGGEIRTHGRVTPTTIFKTVAFNRSATPPFKSCLQHIVHREQEKQKNVNTIITKTFD